MLKFRHIFSFVVLLLQGVLTIRVVARLLATRHGVRVERHAGAGATGEVTVLAPVLNERHRLEPCLLGLVAQGPIVREVLVIDGGSTDGTQDLVREYMERDTRIRLLDASPVPDEINAKAYGLARGLDEADPASPWILTIDADVRADPYLASSIVAHAEANAQAVTSLATRQTLGSMAEGLVHPSMLATLVYRFGIPGHATTSPRQVQANGQCMLLRRDVLDRIGGITGVLHSVCEDVTLARNAAASGYSVGFHESRDLASVAMYDGALDAWRNWSRSLPMRDQHQPGMSAIGWAEVTLVQALPLWIVMWCVARGRAGDRLARLNGGLVCMRFGILLGMARAYVQPPPTYWASPLLDVPVAARLWQMALRRTHTWRGRSFRSGGS